MKVNTKYIILSLLLICGVSLFSEISGSFDAKLAFPFEKESFNKITERNNLLEQTHLSGSSNSASVALPPEARTLPPDSGTIYPVRKTQITEYQDLTKTNPIDLRDPSNVSTEVVYDINNNIYLFKTKIDNDEWSTPFTLNPEQYSNYWLRKSMSDYFKIKNAEAFAKGEDKSGFSLRDVKVNLNALDRIFGPGGVQVQPNGYVETLMGIKNTKTDNPTIPDRNRSRTMFDFDTKIQVNAKASVGNKVNFDLNYDTESTFDFDTKRVKLAYEGEEDEILKYLEAGNVSMTTTNSLIQGGASLFGIKADLQFGKLKVSSVISQQESQSQTVNSQGGLQTMPYEFKVDQYDENQHFFLAHYFRDNFDKGMSALPYVRSKILISKIEVWVTNKQSNYNNPRNIVGFADLAESLHIGNNKWQGTGEQNNIPFNKANNLYSTAITDYANARDISQTTNVLSIQGGLDTGFDYDKLENARLLEASEYTLNEKLGFISLNIPLSSDQILAVAYEYTLDGQKSYQVGEFASDISTDFQGDGKSGALYVKLLKPVSMSPNAYTWHLMMKNVYKLGATQVQKDNFRLNITYQSDTLGTYINYIPAGRIQDQLLLRVMQLDRLNAQNQSSPDGIFDFIEGYTILPENGRIIFPVTEPFGSHLKTMIGNDALAEKYIYQELYDSTQTVAQQFADKNKFKISGTYRASLSSSVINLNAMNVARGSVRVTSNGITLTENVDYTVDYTAGTVTIINQSLIDSNANISATLEDQSLYSLKRKTLLGVNLSYDFSRDFSIGGTIMHMYEKPINMKTGIGEESLKNTIWGLNMSYRTSSQWLTNVIDQVPWITATAPSTIAFNAEFAHMIAGHYENQYTGGYSYLDDFESAKSRISILNPFGWKLSSTPSHFKESTYINDPEYGYNRAHLAWFMIDNMFTYKNSSITPTHIKNDDPQRSDHRVRRIDQSEIYPDRDRLSNEAASITTLNLSFYPEERGPYNVDAATMNSEGKFTDPEKRWGGITRKLDNTNFETSNIEYIEFWLMDPYAYDKDNSNISHKGGKLYINLGEISEDILKDGKKFYENGLPTDGSQNDVEQTVWGHVPTRQSTVYAFDNSLSDAARRLQDAGLNGLTTAQELEFGIYKDFVAALSTKLSPDALTRMQNDPYSPLRDPGGDNYRHYRGNELDRNEVSILDRYKYYNGTEGNSISDNSENQTYATAATTLPDVEDLNQDYTMNETESYYQYEIPIEPNMEIGANKYIVARRDTTVSLVNNTMDRITWYQFRIPVREFDSRVGTMNDIRTVRFIRMFLTDFDEETYLRFATLDLVRSEWRAYTKPLDSESMGTGIINVSAVNIEENIDKKPVSYVIPPGVSRIVDPTQAQLRQENEQAMSFQILDLGPKNARAVFKSANYDLRRYKRLQMFTHAEQLIDGPELNRGEMTAFLRLGSDYTNNYYEYEIPLSITPPGEYSSRVTADREAVWPVDNMFDFPLELFTDLKLERNREKRKANATVSFTSVYSIYDPDKPNNKVSIIGNPSLAEVSVMMIGVRNNATVQKSAEIWVNELRMTDYDDEGGWAAQANLNIGLSDIGSINFSGRKETAGFGAIDQNMQQRRNDDFSSYTISTNVDIGKLLPDKVKLSAPLFYSYSSQTVTPKYDPLDKDIKMEDALEVVETKAEKDSIKNLAQDKTVTKNFSLTNVRLNINSKNPMPYDPANFSFGYAFSKTDISSPTTAYDRTENYRASMSYSYSPMVNPWEPFKNAGNDKAWSKYPKSLSFNYLPNNISFNSFITRFYTETLTRDLESYMIGGDNSKNQILTFSQNFYWDRDFSITWDFMKNLKFSMQTGTRAELENPYLEVNKNINPDDYQKFKDSVGNTIKNLGTPLSYRQTTQLTYTLPTQNIPILDWINSSANYSSEYTWDRGEDVTVTDVYGDTETFEVGNTISNFFSLNFTNQLNMVNLYNKSSFLKKVNDKFEPQRSGRSQRQTRQRPAQRTKRFEKDIRLNTDSATVISHGLGTKNIIVTAKEKGRTIKLKYKRLDENRIRINRKDTAQIKLSIIDRGEPEETLLYKIAEYGARGLMSVRNISFNYSIRNETALSGFRPGVGDVFGQDRTNHGLIPGLGFAFGLEGGENFFDRVLNNEWLILDGENLNPAVYNSIRKFDIDARIEPIRGLKINLKALHEKNNRTSYQYSTNNTLTTSGGSFAMTTITLSSAFDSGNAKNGYKSNAFSKFIKNIDVITGRIEGIYKDNLSYPTTGFLQGTNYGKYNPDEHGGVDKYSSDVLIPAFLSAYTGKNVNKMSLSPFPALTAILPNWSITYDGLSSLPWFKERFKNFRLMHSYTGRYHVGSYNSHVTWIEAEGGNGWGFSQALDLGTTNSTPISPTSMFDISSVTITEQFSPLLGASGTFDNNLELSLRYNYGRILNLNIPAYQLVETLQKDFVIGAGYKVNEFNRILGLPARNGFNNDLNVKVDLSNRRQQSLIRRLEADFTEATSGTTTTTIKISAEYTMSRSLVLRTYFDRVVNTPLISSAGFPTANTNIGISLRFMLNQ